MGIFQLPLLISPCSCVSDPLVHHGRHFGRTLHAMSSIQVLLTNGILHMGELADQLEETFTAELVIFRVLPHLTNESIPGKEESITCLQNCCRWCRV